GAASARRRSVGLQAQAGEVRQHRGRAPGADPVRRRVLAGARAAAPEREAVAMLQTKTIVAVGALAIMGGAFAYTATRKDPHVKKASTGPVGNTAAPAAIVAKDVDEVAISDVGKPKLVLKKGADGTWKLSEPVADTADQKNVEAA